MMPLFSLSQYFFVFGVFFASRDPRVPGWLATAFGFWSGRALATGTAWAGLCLIHHHHYKAPENKRHWGLLSPGWGFQYKANAPEWPSLPTNALAEERPGIVLFLSWIMAIRKVSQTSTKSGVSFVD